VQWRARRSLEWIMSAGAALPSWLLLDWAGKKIFEESKPSYQLEETSQ
jgi:hypothetical protein